MPSHETSKEDADSESGSETDSCPVSSRVNVSSTATTQEGSVRPLPLRALVNAAFMAAALAALLFAADGGSGLVINLLRMGLELPSGRNRAHRELTTDPTAAAPSTCDRSCKGSFTCRERVAFLMNDARKRFEVCAALHQVNDLECSADCECPLPRRGEEGGTTCQTSSRYEVRAYHQNLYRWAARDRSLNYLSLCEYIGANAKYGFDLAGFQEEWDVQNDCARGGGVAKIGTGDNALYRSRNAASSVACTGTTKIKLNPSPENVQDRFLTLATCAQNGRAFVFATSHWCVDWRHNGECSGSKAWNREENAEETLKGLDDASRGVYPVIFTCDCNANGGPAVQLMQEHGYLVAAQSRLHWGFDYIWYYNPPSALHALRPLGVQVQSYRTSPSHPGPGAYNYHGSDHPGLFRSFELVR
jgi:hypothetical protein